jgi:hypothetical protein
MKSIEKMLLIVLVSEIFGCTSSRLPNTPHHTKRELRKSMRYSTWEYKMPKVDIYQNYTLK